MRLFTAIDITPEIEDHLTTLLNHLRPLAKITWSPPKNMHITTKFIGEWPEDRVPELQRILAGAGSPGPIPIAVRNLGWFPNPRHPRVFWAGVEGGKPLETLAHATEDALHTIGVPREERKYSPHLTLARIRESVPLDPLRRAIDSLPSTDFGSFEATVFYLYLSRGGKYTKLADFTLT